MDGRLFATAAVVGVLGMMCAGCGQGATQARAEAQILAAQNAGEPANASGCPKQDIQKACLTLKGAGGVIYDISDAGVDASRGKAVSVVGRDKGESSACGKVLSDVTFDYSGISCAAPVTAATTAPASGG